MENKNKNTIWLIIAILLTCVALFAMFIMKKPEEPPKQPISTISQVEENEQEEEKYEITAATLGKEEKIQIKFKDTEKTGVFTLGDFTNFFIYLPENEWLTDNYNTWYLNGHQEVSISVYKQLFTDVESDMKCLEADYNYVKLESYDNVMILEEDGFISIVKLVPSESENAVFELNFIYPAPAENEVSPYAEMWQPIFDTFGIFDATLLDY